MKKQKQIIEPEVVEIKITRPLKIEWVCPHCRKQNEELFYSYIGPVWVQCDYCGRMFIAER